MLNTNKSTNDRSIDSSVLDDVRKHIAARVIGQQYLRIADKYRMVLLAHDEIVFVVPERKVKQAKADLLETLSTPPDWCSDAPLSGEVGVFDTYVKM